ncbi:Stk1 family PASTA domain-containing Ser/Thr kinase [Neobacillus notoginsengisoli]|uniref:Serine/threonine-protein kinase PrkC n=1 Tax=Neobacillus notoginsengisoli TaxID=1578198 RepID=A0A417YQD2_9BACI|nr:Stk1 family PASTA domain-containing Ser/Thr kinase [Neobacillus notoginsengisoli]RHW36457.1 Stk1 family PASTA domain-containing Ser/Thr kinase [Neobacillus notoginsengisoli]
MMIGKRISGRYKILDAIGGGGMANVYLAHDVILDRNVAVKVLRLDFANDEEFIRRFHREAQSATSLAHPNIVSIYDVGEEEGIYYIVMEFVDGQTLKQYIQQFSPLRVDAAIDIMRQLTSAIAHAHQNHIVHRDIKPHNILVDNKGNVKITDFGIAMALSATSITQTNSVLGSVHYLSPEQARGGMANKKSDIYSLGIVMFELLTGRLPFFGESAVSIALKHLQTETPSIRRWNPQIPQSVENIVLKATAKDPFLRYDSVEEMEEDLQTSLYPERLNEPKFFVPEDIDATKAIPVITAEQSVKNLDETIVHGQAKHEETAAKPKQGNEKKKRKKWPIILVSTFILLVLLGIGAITVFPGIFGAKDREIPDVSGGTLDNAISELKQAGFTIGDTKEITHEDIQEGLIVKTDPPAGRTVKEGTEIDLYVSSGKEKFELSDYKDRQYDTVAALLDKENFKDIRANEIYDDSDPGTILKQNLPPGRSVVPEETELEFTVSKGPEKITLRDLRGYNEKTLDDYADLTGLNIKKAEPVYDDNVDKGLVISHTPPPGTQLVKGETVTVVLSKGKEEILPRTYRKEVMVEYNPDVPGQPQEYAILIDDVEHSMTEAADTGVITANRTFVIELKVPYGKKAGYKIMLDNRVIEDETITYDEAQ